MSNKKCNVFTSNFGTLPLRFTLKDGELFVSKSDLTKIFYEFTLQIIAILLKN